MKKITLKLDCWINNDELQNYLMQLNGIIKVDIDKEQSILNILYDMNLINIYMIKKEIDLFLEIKNIPSIISFNKYSEEITKEYVVNIKDLCCEYCLKGYIEELLLLDGIESVSCSFDNVNKKNVEIYLNYNELVISLEEIVKLENKFNYNN